ncbi:MAG: NAD(P)H-hydrate dehydratase [Gemmatimonadota bacterium]
MAPIDTLLPLATGAEMRDWERATFDGGDIGERVVLESAGRAAAVAIARTFPEGEVVAAVGKGNNGGDALVALRTLRAWGRSVRAQPVGDVEWSRGLTHGWEIPVAAAGAGFATAGVVVDGILGTGASGPPREPIGGVVDAINASGRPVVALDGPTGVDLSTGAIPGAAVRADLTVTFGILKRGLLLHPGRSLAGRVLLAEVGLPPWDDGPWSGAVVTDGWANARLPRIPADAHKGSVGLVGVVAGRRGVGGAAIMAAMGALRAGTGGVRVVSADANRTAIHAAVPEAVFVDRESEDVLDQLAGTRAVLIGPGIGTDEGSRALLSSILHAFAGPILLDADALTLLAADANALTPDVASRCVMTPHPGELGRLLGCETGDVLADRFGTARAAAERFGCAVLAKGAPSIVAAPFGPIVVAVTGHSGVATGGMGDTLSGVVAALLAGGAAPRDAAAMGLHFSGRAAERAGRGRGLLPRDVAEALPGVIAGDAEPIVPQPPFLLDLPRPR